MSRRSSREFAMKLIYQMDIQKEDHEQQINESLTENELSDKEKNYVVDVVEGVQKNITFLDTEVEKYSKGWKLSRISKVDLAVLRLCVYEIAFRKDIPFNVSVNEAVELSKKFSGTEASAFVNGILSNMEKLKINDIQADQEKKADIK
jgi:N utilization substance protein B